MTPRRRSTTLTDPQIKVLKVIEDYQNTNGFPPSIRDIQDMGKFSSTSVVNYYLEQLETMCKAVDLKLDRTSIESLGEASA